VVGVGESDFLTGFLATGAKKDEAIGIPADALIDNVVEYVSDDRAGAIYRITHTP